MGPEGGSLDDEEDEPPPLSRSHSAHALRHVHGVP